ncbi:hypothetical protein KUTeg_012914 [Tegillarca granosa]|uniref:Nuclear pore complex protein Nup133 n=1 Tax=Tegillarca granosa TaxID=220873 RepID=A0ABQ9EXD2_TEGGR|nr:hypothetical protein KUTeg_012914 [Tegillarca granosa]
MHVQNFPGKYITTMFSPRAPTTRSKSSPFLKTPQSNRPQNRRVSNLFTPKGRTPAGKNAGNRSLQTSQVIEETDQHRVESFGTPLPVLIREALTLADKHTEITVKVDPSGWAWLVGGRKLFIWRYKHGQTKRNSVFCKELMLPPSDLAHNADRVCVIPDKTDQQSASCVAVSPEGIVRYWANIAYEGSSMEISAELRGEECACVINFPPFGCLLATTTSSLVLLSPVQGQTSMVCHALKGSQGMFAGISRRMSSFIFGASPLQATGAPLQAIVPGNMDHEERSFYVLSGTLLQRWSVYDGCTEKLFYQIDADRINGVVILGAGVNSEVNTVLHFALAYIVTEMSGTPVALDDLVVIDHTDRYEENTEHQLQNYKLLVPDTHHRISYIYDKERILFMPGNSQEVVDLAAPGGNILGAGLCDRIGVFFSGSTGLFSLTSAQKQEVSIMDEPVEEISRADMSVMAASSSQIQELSISEDKTARLKAVFLEAMRGNTSIAQAGLAELFPLGSETDSELDKHVVNLSQDIIDDFPSSDPRWAESRQVVPGKESLMLTRNVLCEHAEKIQAAIALRQLHSEYVGIIDSSIRKVLERRGNASILNDLTPQDIFYREVSKVHEIVEAMMEYEDEFLLCNVTTPEVLTVISSVNAILEYTRTLEEAIPEVQDSDIQEMLFQQLVSFADIILGGYAYQLESLVQAGKQTVHFTELQRRYEQDRPYLILPLLENERFELAASLAEKYLDFEILVRLCEQTNSSDRIERYLTQFADKGFSDFLYNWYMKEGKRGKLMTLPISQHAELGQFLQSDDTLMSLSKLSGLASEEQSDLVKRNITETWYRQRYYESHVTFRAYKGMVKFYFKIFIISPDILMLFSAIVLYIKSHLILPHIEKALLGNKSYTCTYSTSVLECFSNTI